MIKSYNFSVSDGVNLAWHETGAGRPVVLIHGYFSDTPSNWIKYGHAALLADAAVIIMMMLVVNFDVAPKGRFHADNTPPYGFYFLRFLRVLNKGTRS
jgi:hypothetical protein